MEKNTSWGRVAGWYDTLLGEEGTYQKDLILPNLLRLMSLKRVEVVLDVACGQGFFSREFSRLAGRTIGTDISSELVALAKEKDKITDYRVASADNLDFLKDQEVDKAVIVLAAQNIENLNGVLKEISRVLKVKGRFYCVLNHPAFRIPKASSWGWDEERQIQYRRIDRYISESKERIQMHPGDSPDVYTLSFHRPLQTYFKALNKAGFAVSKLEEWTSLKTSGKGPRKIAEDRARKEIPLFMAVEAVKIEI